MAKTLELTDKEVALLAVAVDNWESGLVASKTDVINDGTLDMEELLTVASQLGEQVVQCQVLRFKLTEGP